MAYLKEIIITKRKAAILRLFDANIVNSVYLSDFDLDMILGIVDKLNEVVNNPEGYFLWGQEQIMINSYPDMSSCFDDSEKVSLPSVPTRDLLDLMVAVRNFREFYSNTNNLKDIIGQGFTLIKSNFEYYKRYPNSNYYSITIKGIDIILIILKEDFSLSESEYVNQINVPKRSTS